MPDSALSEGFRNRIWPCWGARKQISDRSATPSFLLSNVACISLQGVYRTACLWGHPLAQRRLWLNPKQAASPAKSMSRCSERQRATTYLNAPHHDMQFLILFGWNNTTVEHGTTYSSSFDKRPTVMKARIPTNTERPQRSFCPYYLVNAGLTTFFHGVPTAQRIHNELVSSVIRLTK